MGLGSGRVPLDEGDVAAGLTLWREELGKHQPLLKYVGAGLDA